MKFLFFTLIFITFSSIQLLGQPPWPTLPPTYLTTKGPIPNNIDVTYELNGTVRFETINNTGCDIDFQTWFIVELIFINENQEEIVEDVIPLKVLNYTLLAESQGSITNYQLFQLNELPDPGTGRFYRVKATGIYLRLPGMAGFKDLYPTDHGHYFFFEELEEPCNCFIPYFDFTSTKVTLTIEPCQ